jgi:hypothetical protein
MANVMRMLQETSKGVNEKVHSALKRQEQGIVAAPKRKKELLDRDVDMETTETIHIDAEKMWAYLEFEATSFGDGMTAGKVGPLFKILKRKIPKKGGNGIFIQAVRRYPSSSVKANKNRGEDNIEKTLYLEPSKPEKFGLELGRDNYSISIKGLSHSRVAIKVTAYSYFPHLN